MYAILLIVAVVVCAVQSQPLYGIPIDSVEDIPLHEMSKRFINPWFTNGGFSNDVFSKIRSKRSSGEDCEKLRLCKLHARSNRNFFAAFELYFVNRENARLWDHQARSLAECERRFSCYR